MGARQFRKAIQALDKNYHQQGRDEPRQWVDAGEDQDIQAEYRNDEETPCIHNVRQLM